MNGYEFVCKVLEATGGDVTPLIAATNGYETEWLEFKAATAPGAEGMKPGESLGDYRWHVAKALFAMANATGGAVILGVRETGDRNAPVAPLGLAPSGFNGDREKFVRTLGEQVLEARDWKTGHGGGDIWAPAAGHAKCRPIFCTFKDCDVLVVLVEPIAQDAEEGLFLTHRRNHVEREVLLVRRRGDQGSTDELSRHREINAWWRQRDIERPELDQQFEALRRTWQHRLLSDDPLARPRVGESEAVELDAALHEWSETFRREWERLVRDAEDPATEAPGGFQVPRRIFDARLARSELEPVDDEDLPQATEHYAAVPRDEGSIDLPRALRDNRRVFIYGEPGSGKTTRVRHAVYNLLRYGGSESRVPLYVSLSGFADGESLAARVALGCHLSPEQLELALSGDRVVLVLDGFNEAGSGREALEQDLFALLRRHPLVHVALTSRNLEHGRLLGEPFVCQVPPFTFEEQRAFLREVFSWQPERIDSTLRAIHAQPGGAQLASSPLNLCLLVNIERRDIENAGRKRLFQQAFESWLEREREQAEAAGEAGFPELELATALLGSIAFTMRIGELQHVDLQTTQFDMIGRLEDEQIQAIERMSQLPMFFRYDTATRHFGFAHETYQEFFTATHFLAHPDRIARMPAEHTRRWFVVLATLYDLAPEPEPALVEALWNADPLYALYSPATDAMLEASAPPREPWRQMMAAVMLGKADAQQLPDMNGLGPKPAKAIKAVMVDEQMWGACSRHAAPRQRMQRLTALGFAVFDPFALLLKYLSRASPEIGDTLRHTDYGLTAFVLGEFPGFLLGREQLPYLATAVLENPEAHMRNGLLSLSRGFRAFLVDPGVLSLHTWKRLVDKFGQMKTLRVSFRNACIEYGYSFLGRYPEIASTSVDYLLQEWEQIPKAVQAPLIDHLPGLAILRMLDERLLSPGDIEESVWKRLGSEASANVNVMVAAVRFGKIDPARIPQDLRAKFLAEEASAAVMLRHGLARLDELEPRVREAFLADATVMAIVDALGAGSLAWSQLDAARHRLVEAALQPGAVLRLGTAQADAVLTWSEELLRALAATDSADYEDDLATLAFTVKLPPPGDSFAAHPLLPAMVYLGNELADAPPGTDRVLCRLKYRSDVHAYHLESAAVWIADSAPQRWSGGHDAVAAALHSLAAADMGSPDAQTEQLLLASAQPAAKEALLRSGAWTLERLQQHEAAFALPIPEELHDPARRFAAQQTLRARTWTLYVRSISRLDGREFFFAAHPAFPVGRFEVSGPCEQFPVSVGDVMVAQVAAAPINSEGDVRYRVVQGRILEGVTTRINVDRRLIRLGAYTQAAVSRLIDAALRDGAYEFFREIVDQGSIGAAALIELQASAPVLVLDEVAPEAVASLNARLARHPWVLSVSGMARHDDGNVPYFTARSPAFVWSRAQNPPRPRELRLLCLRGEPDPGPGDYVMTRVELIHRDGRFLLHTSGRWSAVPAEAIAPREPDAASLQWAVELLASEQRARLGIELGDLAPGFVERIVPLAGSELVAELAVAACIDAGMARRVGAHCSADALLAMARHGAVDAALGAQWVAEGRLDGSCLDPALLAHWAAGCRAADLVALFDKGYAKPGDISGDRADSLIGQPHEHPFVQWLWSHREAIWPSGMTQQTLARHYAETAPIACVLCELAAGLLKPADVPRARVHKALEARDPRTLARFMEVGLASWEDIPERRWRAVYELSLHNDQARAAELLAAMPVAVAGLLLRDGVARIQDFDPARIDALFAKLRLDEIQALAARDGVEHDDLAPELRERLARRAPLPALVAMVRKGLLAADEAAARAGERVVDAPASAVLDALQLELLDSAALREQAVATPALRVARRNWGEAMSLKQAIRAVRLGLFTPDEFGAERRVALARQLSAATASQAVICGLVARDEVAEDLRASLRDAAADSPGLAAELCQAGMQQVSDFAIDTRLRWAQRCAAPMLLRLIDAGLVDAETVRELGPERREELLHWPSAACRLHERQLVDATSFDAGHREAWLASSDVAGVIACVRAGLLEPAAIAADALRSWYAEAQIGRVWDMIEAHLVPPPDAVGWDRLLRTLSVARLVRLGTEFGCSANRFSPQARAQRLRRLTPEEAARLVKAGVLEHADVEARNLTTWGERGMLSRHVAGVLAGAGLLRAWDVPAPLRARWIAEVRSLAQAVDGVRLELFGWEQIAAGQRAGLLQDANARTAVSALRAGLAQAADFRQRQRCAFAAEAHTNPELAHDLLDLGLLPDPDGEADAPAAPAAQPAAAAPAAETGRFSRSRVEDPAQRALLKQELGAQRWRMTVSQITSQFGFLSHPNFPDGVYFRPGPCFGPTSPGVGAQVEVCVGVGFDTKRGSGSYVASDGRVLAAGEEAEAAAAT